MSTAPAHLFPFLSLLLAFLYGLFGFFLTTKVKKELKYIIKFTFLINNKLLLSKKSYILYNE